MFPAFRRRALWGWGVALVAYVLSHWLPFNGPVLLDLEVYLAGSQRLVEGVGLYNHTPGALPYTYPPISGFLFVPLLWPTPGLRGTVLIILTTACLLRTVQLCLRSLNVHTHLPATLVLGLLTVATCIHPVYSTYSFGQVNLILLWLVAEDVLARQSRWSGWGIGLAAAIKLTPLFFVAVLLFTPLRAIALRGGAAFVGLTVLAWLCAPHDSFLYWTQLIKDPSRVGGVEYVHNQSINGVLWRLLGPGGNGLAWLFLSAVVGVLCIFAVRRCVQEGSYFPALALPALGMLLTSPISWSHHWVWVIPVVAALWVAARRRHWAMLVLVVGAVMIFGLLDLGYLPNTAHAEFAYNPAQHLIAASHPLWAVAVLVAVMFLPTDWWRGRTVEAASPALV